MIARKIVAAMFTHAGGLQDVHDDGNAVPRGGEAHEVVVVGLFAVVRVAEQRGHDDDDHHDDRHRLGTKRQVQRHEQGRQEVHVR